MFVSGKILENLTLGPQRLETSPPVQPPTPPSTPLSPKANEIPKYTSCVSFLPNITITQASSPSIPQILNQNSQKGPLDLDMKKKKSPPSLYTNGTGLNLSTNQMDMMMEATKSKLDGKMNDQKLPGNSSHSPRVSCINFFVFFGRLFNEKCRLEVCIK